MTGKAELKQGLAAMDRGDANAALAWFRKARQAAARPDTRAFAGQRIAEIEEYLRRYGQTLKR